MTRYLLSKLGQAVVTIVLVVLVVFTLLRFMPTAGYFSKEQYKSMNDAEKTAYLRNLGVLDPMPVQLKNFVVGLFHGDLGRSITLYPNMEISNVMAEKIPWARHVLCRCNPCGSFHNYSLLYSGFPFKMV